MPVSNPAKLALMATDSSTSPLLPLPKSRKRSRPTDEVSDQACSARTESKIAVIDKLIRGHCEGWISDPTLRQIEWYRAIVAPSDFVALIESFDDRLRKWMLDSLTYDWNISTGEVILRRMAPNHIHDVLSAELGQAFRKQIENLLDSEKTPKEIKVILKVIDGPYPNLVSTAAVRPSKNASVDPLLKSKRQADNCFCFGTDSQMPVIIEVGNSQNSKDLMVLARSWITQSSRRTKTVITVDLDYQDRLERHENPNVSKATITLYRANLSKTTRPAHFVFHDSSKAGENEQDLELNLTDFLPKKTIDVIKKSESLKGFRFPPMTITAQGLRDILATAERRQQAYDRNSRSPNHSPPAKEDRSEKKQKPTAAAAKMTYKTRSGRKVGKPLSYAA